MIGEKTFTVGGKVYTMFLGNAAQCMLEQRHDKGFFAVVQDAMPDVTPAMLEDPKAMALAARSVRVSALRELAWAALRKHHPELDYEDVSDLTDAVGAAAWGELIGQVIAGSLDQEEAKGSGVAAKGKPSTPRKKRTGGR